MEKSKNPAFLFYSADFLVGCVFLSMEERGQYITLLCLQHQHGHLSESQMKSVGNISDSVMEKFTKDENGLWYNERVEREIEKREKFLEHQQENGKKGGRPKTQTKAEENPNNNPNKTHGFTSGKPKQKPLENDNENDYENEFELLWVLYPRKIGKTVALKHYIKARKNGATFEEVKAGVKAYAEYVKGKDKQYIKHGGTWFSQESWKDELDTKSEFEKEREEMCSFDADEFFGKALKRTYG